MNRYVLKITKSLLGMILYAATANAQIADSAIIKLIREKQIPVLGLGFIDNGKVSISKVYGELKPGVPATINTVFNVASITKTITAMVTLSLVNAGKWDLDEPVYHYWTDPDVASDPRSKRLTTRHILSHRTGFPNWRWMHPDKKLAFEFKPGLKFQYSGEGMEYLRRALEAKFHLSMEQLADSLLFRRLKMHDTHFVWNDSMQERFAMPHNAKGEVLPVDKNTGPNAADLLKTTVPDYTKFLIWVMNGADLSPGLYRQFTSPLARIKDNKYMGLGWVVYPHLEGQIGLSHSGIDPGVNTIAFVLPQSKRALLIFTNSDNGPQIYTELVEAFLKEKGKAIVATEMKD